MLEIISDAPFGVYILRVARIYLNLFSQSPDMYIYGTHISRIFITPDNVEQILSAVHLVRMKDQKLQHIKFFGSQVYFSACNVDASQSIVRSPAWITLLFVCSAPFFSVRRMIALIRALTSRMLNGLVI